MEPSEYHCILPLKEKTIEEMLNLLSNVELRLLCAKYLKTGDRDTRVIARKLSLCAEFTFETKIQLHYECF